MKKKSIVGALIFIVISLLTTFVSAAPESFFWKSDGAGEVATTIVDGLWALCIEKGGKLRTTTYSGEDAGRYSSTYCEKCDGDNVAKEWDGDKYQTKFTVVKEGDGRTNKTIDVKAHQDAMYAIINSGDMDRAQRIIWGMDINTGNQVGSGDDLYRESVAYRAFYEKMQSDGGYNPKDETDVDNIKVAVNQGDKTYTVGPFKISYLDDYHIRPDGTRVNFGEITNLRVINETGNTMELVDIVDSRGSSIRSRQYQYPANGEEFYIVIRGDGHYIHLDLDFRYLRECTGTLYEYSGEVSRWYWTREGNGTHTHSEKDKYHHGWDDENGHHNGYWSYKDVDYDKYRYKLNKEVISPSQELVLYALDGQMHEGTAHLATEVVELEVDNLTIKISGNVFLDQDQGKVNEGNNKIDAGEALSGIEVTLYEVGGGLATPYQSITHKHTGNSSTYGGCYTTPVYHVHVGNENMYGPCYSAVNHTHIGSSAAGGPGTCFETPVYHEHDESCYAASDTEKKNPICGKVEGQTIEFYKNTCGVEVKYVLTCNKVEGQTIDSYAPSCGYSDGTLVNSRTFQNPVLTDENGYYEFIGLDARKKYYVKFTYNGMLYTNVLYNATGDDTSKATEDSQGHTGNRQNFNNKFAEIGSYPSNYRTTDCITGAEIYNRTYLQEDIIDLFKEVAEQVVANKGNEKAAYQAIINKYQATDPDIKSKVQFVADCRISAYTVKTYPQISEFAIEDTPEVIGGKGYPSIYSGQYNQTNVNLGIKARSTFDMALYKDVLKAEVQVNGKTQTYNYDARKAGTNGFSIGVSETDYLNGLRGMYKDSADYTNQNQTREIETDTYDLDMRTEEVANGQSSNYNQNVTGKVNGNYKLNENYENLQQTGNQVNEDRLKIYITYKLAIRNQSSMVGAITELVDYYDTNYKFIEAYVGDINGNKTGDVTKYDTSMYANTEYKSTKNSYNTIYLRPNAETRLANGEEQYIYVVLQLLGPDNDAGTLLSKELLNNNTLTVMNLAEINGYKTYNSKTDSNTPGLVDIDSNPGNLNVSNIDKLTQENIVNYPNIRSMYEDDTSRAPAFIYKLLESRTIEGTVYEDNTGKEARVYTAQEREGNGQIDDQDKRIQGVIVELVEIKNGQMIVRSTTTTNADGWYGFTGFLPGDYTVRYTYGSNDDTAMNKTSTWYKGVNDTSYNGQDYESTTYGTKQGVELGTQNYKTDTTLINKYTENYNNKNAEESTVQIAESTVIDKYNQDGYYWYTVDDKLSDARDDAFRRNQVIDYSKNEYGTEIVNHKAEVFNAYVNPQPEHITQELNRTLANELERRTYRYAYTPEIEVEVEYAKTTTTGNMNANQDAYKHNIVGVDFGIVERPKSELTIDQDVANIKVTAADGVTVLFDTQTGVNNLQWINKGDINKYDKEELINVIMDEEIMSGAKIEITYNLTIRNNSENDIDTTTRAKTILNYVANNLNYEEADNMLNGKPLWKVVTKDSVQNAKNSSFVNNTNGSNNLKLIDLSTQTTILQATEDNPLANTNLKPGEQVTSTLTLKKVLSSESSSDDLSYTNMTEIVEIDNTVGRYDHGAVPGNQDIELQPQEHDTSGASKYVSYNNDGNIDPDHPQDGQVIITPPTGSQYIYYVIGITSTLILAIGIFLIKKFVVDKRKK